MNHTEQVTLVGTGALGQTLALALFEAGFQVKSLFNRNAQKARHLAQKTGTDITGSFPGQWEELGSLVFITTPDGAISETTNKLAQTFPVKNWAEMTVVHCSGIHTDEQLESLKKRGAKTVAMHPLQTFSAVSKPADFQDIFVSLQGDSTAIKNIVKIVEKIGAQPVTISTEGKSYLHAGAVMAANYLVTLLHASGQIAEKGGVDSREAGRIFLPLLRQVLENASKSSPDEILSGPLRRGDVQTIEKHLNLMEEKEGKLYRQLGRYTLEQVVNPKSFSRQQTEALKKLLGTVD